ncbi:hypothetical protein ETB93_00350 [Lactiplantibacillus plantarum]|uniref:hypothetical protein n=1 Tax=Lactiplantibacillus plantarum TaxID=1590 RepID=UPI000FEC49EC|nr:hypothetical protein [Lactiplantibacillus plantarum]QAB27329.1 hypothetical protein EPT58_11870 [Lactiplantibacillus plantarum]RXS63426.1 hypothetical protein ETB93_00350 [Lactiplantibacillus plantarum]
MLLDYDVALEDDFQQFIKQIPAPVRALLDSADPVARHQRQAVYTLFGIPGRPATMTPLVEALAMVSTLDTPSFAPTPTINDLALSKAHAYASQYLLQQFIRTVSHTTMLPPANRHELLTAAQSLPLANLNRLRLNFNQRERIADFLKDTKDRPAKLTSLSGYLATSLAGLDPAICGLARAIGESVGVVLTILTDVQVTRQIADFRERLLMGNYPLPLLFGFENDPGYFYDFFHQAHKPTADQFVATQQRVLMIGVAPALTMANELVDQARLDSQQLPTDLQKRVEQALTRLAAATAQPH